MEMYIAEAVSKRRRELDMTQEELASRLGVSAQAVSNWERSESYPDVTMLPSLSAVLEKRRGLRCSPLLFSPI